MFKIFFLSKNRNLNFYRLLYFIFFKAQASLECTSNICLNGGTCFIYHNKLECSCVSGFIGSSCEYGKILYFFFDISLLTILNLVLALKSNPISLPGICSPNFCSNVGHCQIINNNPTCQCERGYIGLNCEKNICLQPKIIGKCYGYSVTRFYYNSTLRSCQPFQYSGCTGY